MKRLILTILSIFAIAFGGMAEGTMKTHERIAENGYPFWIYTPDGYDGTKAQPIVVFLHGRSLCGRNLNQVLRYGTLDAIKKGMNMPAFVIAPQNPGEAWKPSKLMDIIEWMETNYKVDANRIYVLGMSLGGYGTMDFAGTYPDKIAAAMALCGGCYLKDQTGLGELPFWIIHGCGRERVEKGGGRASGEATHLTSAFRLAAWCIAWRTRTRLLSERHLRLAFRPLAARRRPPRGRIYQHRQRHPKNGIQRTP